jgi:hypothetical protein
MQRDEFLNLLTDATERALAVWELEHRRHASREVRFRVVLNSSHDASADPNLEATYPEDNVERFRDCAEIGEVVDLLWRDGRVPEWIDPAVLRVRGRGTVVGLACCGRYTAEERLLYRHPPEGTLIFNAPSIAWASGQLDKSTFAERRQRLLYRRWQSLRHLRARREHRRAVWGM